ncbi:HisA/HisF-related TIM barrel protein [Amycolatopsis sp., V23-08]|uniref:thiazole synthase n=1 Tax=Amycolatopsis heterodermiae TaxID=3110235 RepID=A0ABU5RHV9_9PSEU|nr:HisA/HisF-related TIM barrel protein [Amycolatopsis sp., V23-08]MEA5365339.1 HisA/HisF-related TIM barrel protein [Amycolatopsis sp., V23-08]
MRDTNSPADAPAGRPWLVAGGVSFTSRLIVGIEQYSDPRLVADVLAAGGCDVFITTYDPAGDRASLLLSDLDEVVDLSRFGWIGTTSFAYSAGEAVDTAKRLRDAFGIEVIKLDVRTPDNLPDGEPTVAAARTLVADGFAVLPFIRPDVDLATRLVDLGAVALRVMASPVASAQGVLDTDAVRAVIDTAGVPIVVEGGLGTPDHVSDAMALGADAVLVNTAIATAPDSPATAAAMRRAVDATRQPEVAGT